MRHLSVHDGLPLEGQARSTLLENMQSLCGRAVFLQDSAPSVAEATLGAVFAWITDVIRHLTPNECWSLLMAMDTEAVERALDPAYHGIERRLLDRAKPMLGTVRTIRPTIFHLTPSALDRLRALGLPYDTTLDPLTAAALWMSKGAAYGQCAWLHQNPRRDPVMAYWTEKGLHLPRRGLCAEGVGMVEKALAHIVRKGSTTLAMQRSVTDRRGCVRVGLALCLLGDPLRLANPHTRFFPEAWKPFVVSTFPEEGSAHAKIQAAKQRVQLPSVTQLLALPADPRSPEELMALFAPTPA